MVENKFCPNCGQENTETRQSFHYLFTHFIEDLTHYDGSFWKTIKALLFRPGRLTKEYLAGKRKLYVPPVKLYIFISFVAFLLPHFLPEYSFFGAKKAKTQNAVEFVKSDTGDESFTVNSNSQKIKARSIRELDSIQLSLPENEKISFFEYNMMKGLLKISKDKDQKKLIEKALESFIHTLPKVLFVYMPTFAFLLWLFHDKKKYYYFDSGIFTLHYFSFLLLAVTLLILINWFIDLFYYLDTITGICTFLFTIYSIFYFFRAHSNFYGERKAVSRFKSFILFFINMILILFISLALFVYSLLSIH